MLVAKFIEILKEVNDLPDLSNSNVIEKIKDQFNSKIRSEQDENERQAIETAYQGWAEDNFDINHFFESVFICDYYSSIVESTLLHLAARNSHIKLVNALIAKGADLNAADNEYGGTPLHWAAKAGNTEVVKLLLDKGKNVSAVCDKGETPLHWAVKKKGNLEVLDTLIKAGAALSPNEWTPLHYAVLYNNEEALSFLLKQDNVDVNAQTNNGTTPLYFAARAGRKNQVELLLARGAEVNVQDKKGNTVLHFAAANPSQYTIGHDRDREKYIDIAKFLLKNGADPSLQNKEGKTPICFAKYKEMRELFLEEEEEKAKMPVKNGGANPLLESNEVKTPIDFAKGQEMTKPSKEAEKAYKMPVIVGVIIGIVSTSLIATLLVDCGLSALVISGIAVGCGIAIGAIVGCAAYMLLKPSTEIKVEQAATEQAAPQGDVYSHS